MAFDIEGAKKAGYSEAEIAGHLASQAKFDLPAAKKAGYSDADVIGHLSASEIPGQRQGAAQIPTEPGANLTPTPEAPKSFLGKVFGNLETIPALAGGMVGGMVAPVVALGASLTSGKYGTQEGVRAGEEAAKRTQAQFYQPRTPEAQRNVEAVGNALAPVIGVPIPTLNALGQATPAAMRAVGDVRASQMAEYVARNERVAAPAKAALQAERVAESTLNAPRIEAAQAARKYDIAVPPAEANPTKGNKFKAILAGNKGLDAQLSLDNVGKFNAAAAKEMGLPENTPLTKPAFTEARNLASGPYRAVEQLPVLEAPAEVLGKIQKLKGDPSLIGGATSNAEIARLVDDAQTHISNGMAGNEILKNIRQMRAKAQRSYKSAGATPDQIDVADTRMGIANALEDLIDSNIQDPKLLNEFRKARVAMAKTYAYEAATDLNTGKLDPQAIAKITAASNELTGTIADIGKIAGNFPSVSQGANVSYSALPTLTRSGLGGSVGYAFGSTVGVPLQGSIAGAGIGGLVGRIAAKRMGTSKYQAANAVPIDYRPPVNNLRPVEPGASNIVPYDYGQQTFTPPNFVMQGNQYPARVTPGVANIPNALPAPSNPVNNLRAEDLRARNMAATLDQQAQAAAEAQASTARRPAAGEVLFDLDPVTGRLKEVSQGLKGATPETFQNFGSSLKTAAEKIAQGKSFDMTAAERVAFNKTKVDLAEVVPGFSKLDDKAVLAKMMDREWVASAIKKAQEQADAQAIVAAKATTAKARNEAIKQRDILTDRAEALQDALGKPRPVQKGGQGPKTRAFQRNMLTPEQEIQNALAP